MTSAREAIERAERAYRAGDFKLARSSARRAREISDDRGIAVRARRILRATGIDPVAAVLFGATAALLAFLILRYVL